MKTINFDDCIKSYDKTLFYKNDFSLDGADPGAIYCTKEMNEQWGGYFYVYVTGDKRTENGNHVAYKCYRSADLSNWETIGQAGEGYSMTVNEDDWAEKFFWAPEVIFNPKDKKFYMYFSASSHLATPTSEYTANEEDKWSGLYLSVAVSETPAGPFVMVSSEDCEGGVNANGDVISRFNPVFNFERKMNIGHTWSAIDISPFFAPDGNMYIYFAKHVDAFHKGICIYGMRMKDMISPDYETLTQLTYPSVKKVENKPGCVDEITEGEFIRDGGVNEGPFMTYHNGYYYLTYSPFGFGSREYSIMQAVSKSPLGPFDKVAREIGNPSLGINETNDYMAGTGHHNFAYADGEIIAVYHAHRDPVCPYDEQKRFKGRVVSVDKMKFVKNERLGYDILMGNGPTASVQPIATVNAKYVNVAHKAMIKSNATKGENYLYDGMFATQKFDWHKQAQFENSANITLSFSEVQSVKAVMVYNSASFDTAFESVDKIEYVLENGDTVMCENVQCSPENVNKDLKFMRQGGSAICVTEELKVKQINISVSKKYSDKSAEIEIGEIVVLAKK